MLRGGIVSLLALVSLLILAGCDDPVTDERAFRLPLLGMWVQLHNKSVEEFLEFTRDGTIRNALGEPIGTYESDGAWDRVHISVPGRPEIKSRFVIAAGGRSLSLLDTSIRPFVKATRETHMRAKLALHEPKIMANLKEISEAAAELRRSTGRKDVAFSEVVGEGKLIPSITPVAGEDYTQLVLNGDALLRVTTEYGFEVIDQ